MKKLSLTFLFLAVVFAGISSAETNMVKAQNYLKAGRTAWAIEALEQEISVNSNNADAYYMLGKVYLEQKNYCRAEKEFSSAVAFKPVLRSEIGKAFFQVGKNDSQNAKELFGYAIAFGYSTKEVVAYLVNSGQFELAGYFQPSLNEGMADKYYALGNSANGETSLAYYREAKKYSGKYNEAIKGKLLAVSKAKFDEKEIAFWRNAASEFGEIPADCVIYEPGTYTFSLKAGEKTDHWIEQSAKVTAYGVSSSDDKFELVFPDGEVVPAWTPGEWPDKYKFKIWAVTDQPKIEMVLDGDTKTSVAMKQ